MAAQKKSIQSQGGAVRATKLSTEKRSEIARKAARARWASEGKLSFRIAKYGAHGRPLEIGDIQIPCYVLDNEVRVLAQRGIQLGIGMSASGPNNGTPRLIGLMRSLLKKGINIRGLDARLQEPIKFIHPQGGATLLGYDAKILPDICAVIIDAQNAGKLKRTQQKLARACATLQHAFATVGIIALVDEATGYQEHRARDSLAQILEKFVQKELRPWVKTFPVDFYAQVYRLNGWEFPEDCSYPGVVGHWTNNLVYRRLAPGVLDELRSLTPRNDQGKLKHRLFQHLTDDTGHPKLREHLAGVIMLMKYSVNWRQFMDRMDREFPQFGKNLMLPFPDGYEAPDYHPDA